MLSGFCSAPLEHWSVSVVLCGRFKSYTTVASSVIFFTGEVLESNIAHCLYVVVLCMLYKIRGYPMLPHYDALLVPYVPVRAYRHTSASPSSLVGILMRLPAAEPRSTAWLLFTSQYLRGTILVTLYSIVWDWKVLRAWRPWPILFLYLSIFCLLFAISHLSFHLLVLWGWGLWTDRAFITLSLPCITDLFWSVHAACKTLS